MENDLISRSKLMKILEEEHGGTRRIYSSLIDYRDKEVCKGELGTYARVKRIVEEAPAVDAVEVVRCGECKHYRPQKPIISRNGNVKYCCRSSYVKVKADDFCSYGERRNDG